MEDDVLYGVLVTVAVCDDNGNMTRDFGYLYDSGYVYNTCEEALRSYQMVGLTFQQEKVLWSYLRKWIGDNEGLYLMYEVTTSDDGTECGEYIPIGHNAD